MIRFKKVGPLKVLDVWFENNTFLTTKSKIAILHSNDVIEKEKYDFSFCDIYSHTGYYCITGGAV